MTNYLFGPEYYLWHYTKSYLSFVTPYIVSKKIVELADKQWTLSDQVIFDMFAGIGTDTVSLSAYTKNIVCTEIIPERFKMLKHNIKQASCDCTIEIHNQDCCDKIDNNEISLVFFDPPWGQTFTSDKEFSFADLKLDNNIKILNLAQTMLNRYGKMIIKSPIKCDSFDKLFKDNIVASYSFPKQRLKFLFLEGSHLKENRSS